MLTCGYRLKNRYRKGCAGAYRYGFNGKEKDTDGEWGSNTHYDYGFRIYNPAIAKFLSVDPLTGSYSMLTPYQFASNTPIAAIDLDGLEAEIIVDKALSTIKKISSAFETIKTLYNSVQLGAHKIDEAAKSLDNMVNDGASASEVSEALFLEFVTGLGPETRYFDESHIFTQSLMESRTTKIALEKWYQGYKDFEKGKRPDAPEFYAVSWPDLNGSFPFFHPNESGPLRELIEDKEFTTSQFTGSAKYFFTYNEEDKVLELFVLDTKTNNSLFFHLTGDEHTRDEFPIMGETIQIYDFNLTLEEILDIIIEEDDSSTDHKMGPHAGRSPSYPIPSNGKDSKKEGG